ncbi:MAG TPA: UDP-glucose 4-epimerase GalE [Sphingomonadales bacterium]
MKVLVTGGAGYIGSHAVVELVAAGHEVVILDNLSNAKPEAVRRVSAITQREIPFVQGDIRDRETLRRLFAAHDLDAVMHFAGLKAVGESVEKPLAYYDNNVTGSLTLFEVMGEAGCKSIIFSSSATVYGDPASVPIREDFPTSATNPYGRSKLMIEEMLRDLAASDPTWRVVLLRYFNPVGAHESGMIGEDPNGIPNNLVPYIAQVAIGRLPRLRVFGGDWPTRDGTGVRDYIHVVDLARGHVAALAWLGRSRGVGIFNLGTGRGYSVLEMVRAFAEASGRDIPYEIVGRRPGDIAECYADPSLAERELGWRAERTLAQMCADSWRWQSMNPEGYGAA